ncbi:hypothetical protein [Xanthomonas citri]|uniref:hypothetical protein n=1 Tax=Xanthomonas citri TaxID=346 RepID=UPI00131D403A|nr:hypothetical protein [Xanthomonas citri]
MSWRTPSSLKWLIVKRSRLSGTVDQLTSGRAKLLEQLEDIQHRLEKVRHDLAGVDHVLGLHEIKIEPETITPVIPHRARSLMAFGELTRLIYRALRDAGGKSTTRDIVDFILRADPKLQRLDYDYVRQKVRHRLKGMVRTGRIASEVIPGKTLYTGQSARIHWKLIQLDADHAARRDKK